MIAECLKGFIIGLSIAAPLGPIGIICINRTLQYGWKSGFISGCGAATADGIYGIIAASGLAYITILLSKYNYLVQMAGGIFLLYFGIKIILYDSKFKYEVVHKNYLLYQYINTLLLTLSNPLTIISFIGIIGGVSFNEVVNNHLVNISLLILGLILGSVTWWLILCTSVKFIKNILNSFYLYCINIFSGLILLLFGIISLKKLYI